MKDYAEEFQKKIAAIKQDSQYVRIINAGVMNHGKSSLFNSLLDEVHFAEQDIRTTMVAGEAMWGKDVYLVDTPGLSAEASDDAEAYAAYRRANMIVFCHTAKVGELREAELVAINGMKKLFEDDAFFWRHFCLVITFLDADSPNAIAIIKNKSLADIETYCGGKDFHTFLISNTRYRKGRDENKEALVKLSGIPDLKDFLKSQVEMLRKENSALSKLRIRQEKEDALTMLKAEKEQIQKVILQKKHQLGKRQKNILDQLESALNDFNESEEQLDYEIASFNRMCEELEELEERHNRERY